MLAYAKPKILMLDDDQTLLDVMDFYFSEQFQDTVLLKTFSKSSDFLLHVERYCYLPESAIDILKAFYSGVINKENIAKTLHDLADLSAIIVLDQELRDEEITGIDLSAQIRKYFPLSYICMLTSNVPETKAIELHNNRNIDLFVDKKDNEAIINLQKYIARYIDTSNHDFLIDSIDVFEFSGNLDDADYQANKKLFLKEHHPICFLTINENGDIAIMQENKDIDYWQFNSNTKLFTPL